MPLTFECPICGTVFSRSPSQIGARAFCSNRCRNSLFRGAGSSRWRGGRYLQGGYLFVLTDDGYVQEHRLVAAQKLGRALRPEEKVHHVNGVKTDNRPENLVVLSQSEHTARHGPTRGLPVDDWTSRGGPCAECGGTERAHYAHGVCAVCYQRRRRRQQSRRHV